MALNQTNLTGITNLGEYFTLINNDTSGLFFGLVLVSLFIVIVWRMSNEGVMRGVVGGSLVCFFLSLFGLWGGFLAPVWSIIFGLILASGLFYVTFSNR